MKLIFVCLAIIIVCSPSVQQTSVRNEERHASEAADRFLKRYRETLNFGSVFDEMGASTAVRGLRNTKFFEQFRISPNLVQQLDDNTLIQAYKTMMDVYYLGTLYNIIEPCTDKDEAKLPDDILTVISNSRFANLNEEGSVESKPIINTKKDFQDYIELNSQLSILYRRHLPSNPFESPEYKKKNSAFEKRRTQDFVIFDGYENFGISKGTPVYIAKRDFFSLVIVKEMDEMKILTLGIGN